MAIRLREQHCLYLPRAVCFTNILENIVWNKRAVGGSAHTCRNATDPLRTVSQHIRAHAPSPALLRALLQGKPDSLPLSGPRFGNHPLPLYKSLILAYEHAPRYVILTSKAKQSKLQQNSAEPARFFGVLGRESPCCLHLSGHLVSLPILPMELSPLRPPGEFIIPSRADVFRF